MNKRMLYQALDRSFTPALHNEGFSRFDNYYFRKSADDEQRLCVYCETRKARGEVARAFIIDVDYVISHKCIVSLYEQITKNSQLPIAALNRPQMGNLCLIKSKDDLELYEPISATGVTITEACDIAIRSIIDIHLPFLNRIRSVDALLKFARSDTRHIMLHTGKNWFAYLALANVCAGDTVAAREIVHKYFSNATSRKQNVPLVSLVESLSDANRPESA